jgi:hypothetical protein
MPPKQVVLVEPGAHLETGHYREKLSLWWKSFHSAGYAVSVVCALAPDPSFLPEAEFEARNHFLAIVLDVSAGFSARQENQCTSVWSNHLFFAADRASPHIRAGLAESVSPNLDVWK